jgi:anti-sigma factor RsiW
MNHYNHEDWTRYINDELLEDQREKVEDHLYSCDQCLELYMSLVNQSDQLPELTNDDFTEDLMKQLPLEKQSASRKKTFAQHPLFHYGIAATITFALMSSGFFQNLTGFVSTVEAASNTKTEATVTDSLMDKAISIIDLFEPKQQKEGE